FIASWRQDQLKTGAGQRSHYWSVTLFRMQPAVIASLHRTATLLPLALELRQAVGPLAALTKSVADFPQARLAFDRRDGPAEELGGGVEPVGAQVGQPQLLRGLRRGAEVGPAPQRFLAADVLRLLPEGQGRDHAD